jgi:hypothetical protein
MVSIGVAACLKRGNVCSIHLACRESRGIHANEKGHDDVVRHSTLLAAYSFPNSFKAETFPLLTERSDLSVFQ